MKVPCYECLKYPICQNSRRVHCTDFSLYADKVAIKYGYLTTIDNTDHSWDFDSYWDVINSTLPNLDCIRDDDGSDPDRRKRIKDSHDLSM